jgi:hypothetical protein
MIHTYMTPCQTINYKKKGVLTVVIMKKKTYIEGKCDLCKEYLKLYNNRGMPIGDLYPAELFTKNTGP